MPMHEIAPPKGYRASHTNVVPSSFKYSFNTKKNVGTENKKQTRAGSSAAIVQTKQRSKKQVSEVGDQNSKSTGANVEEKMQKTTTV